MEFSTVLMMIIILGILWGGFASLLIRSMRVENRRRESEPQSPVAQGPAD